VILVAGEALIDLVVSLDGSIDAHPGGAPFNVCSTIARLERHAAFLGALSSDRFGRTLARALASEGVDLSATVTVDRPTTLALAELDEVGGATYQFYADGTSAPMVDEAAAAAALELTPTALHVGTLGLVFEPLATATQSLVGGVNDDVLVFLDPNCRPSITPDRAIYLEVVRQCARRADVLKVSDEDLAFLAPGGDAVQETRSLLRPGAVGLVTRGADGVTIVTAGTTVDIAAPQVAVVDTVGAGDGIGGAFLAYWDEHGLGRKDVGDLERVIDAVRFGVRVAAMICERAGADPPRRSEVEARVASLSGEQYVGSPGSGDDGSPDSPD
jgi:fructokinase